MTRFGTISATGLIWSLPEHLAGSKSSRELVLRIHVFMQHSLSQCGSLFPLVPLKLTLIALEGRPNDWEELG